MGCGSFFGSAVGTIDQAFPFQRALYGVSMNECIVVPYVPSRMQKVGPWHETPVSWACFAIFGFGGVMIFHREPSHCSSSGKIGLWPDWPTAKHVVWVAHATLAN